jgi:hypothetical protein
LKPETRRLPLRDYKNEIPAMVWCYQC